MSLLSSFPLAPVRSEWPVCHPLPNGLHLLSQNWKIIILSSFFGTSRKIYRKPNFLSSIQVLKLYHQYLHNNGPGEWFWHLNGHGNQSNNNDFVKNLNFHFPDLTVTFGNFDLNTYDCSHKTILGGYRVVPKVKTFPFMYKTLWLVFIKVEIKWPQVKYARKT